MDAPALTAYFIDALENRFSASGGISRIPGGKERVDSTAWAIHALNRLKPESALAREGQQYLSRQQQQDGSIPLTKDTPAVTWPTSLALLAWDTEAIFQKERLKATQFLLTAKGRILEKQPRALTHNVKLPGWPWVDNTYAWIEPTAMAVLALKSQGKGEHPRVQQGIQLILDRMLVDGGWNYGNKRVFGTPLLPMPESTGIALCAIKGDVHEKTIKKSLLYLKSIYPDTHTPLSLARTISGLSSFNQRPHDVLERIQHCLDLQNRYGPFAPPLLAELALVLKA